MRIKILIFAVLTLMLGACSRVGQDNDSHADITYSDAAGLTECELDYMTGYSTEAFEYGMLADGGIAIINLEHVIARDLNINDALLIYSSGGYVAMFPPHAQLFKENRLPYAKDIWWHEAIPEGIDITSDNISFVFVPGGFIVTYRPGRESQFSKKYLFNFYTLDGEIGSLTTFWRGLEWFRYGITTSSDGQIVIHPNKHDGWPSPISDDAYPPDENLRIDVFIQSGNWVGIGSNVGVLSQIPELREYDFLRVNNRESAYVSYHEREASILWEWLMNPENTWRLVIHNPEPEMLSEVPLQEITNGLWEKWGIQAFVYGGDVTLIGRHGTISQLPEFNEAEHHFALDITGEFELQYIYVPRKRRLRLVAIAHV